MTKSLRARFDIINHLIETYNYQSYLEIGVEDGDNLRQINSQCLIQHGVDPASQHANFKITSDQFFRIIKDEIKYDLIFIDGLHVEDQVERDIENALNHLEPNGTIVVHDCNPPSEWHQRSYEEAQKNGCRLWNGTVWRAFVKFRANRKDLEMSVVNLDWGCGIIRRGKQETIELPKDRTFTYSDLEKNRQEWLNLISGDDFLKMHCNNKKY